MSRRLRLQRPPSSGDANLDLWLQQAADAINALPAFSLFSTTSGPESVVTANAGTLGIDVGTDDAKLWVKISGTTTTGWSRLGLG